MNKQPLWARYSKKLGQKIERPRHAGFFSSEEAAEKGMRLVIGKEGSYAKGHLVHLYWLVDETDGVIADARFQVLGASALIGAAEAACELLIRKNYDQALRISAALIDKQVQDREGVPAFPEESSTHLNLVLGAIEQAAEQCLDIPFAEAYLPTPLDGDPFSGLEDGPHPDWGGLSTEQKLSFIEQVIANDIRPYIELDAGGIEIVSLVDDRKLTIAYQGACTSCHSATGATLDAIQRVLRAKADPHIVVIPDSSFLKFEPHP